MFNRLPSIYRVMVLDCNQDNPQNEQVLKALASNNRLRVLRYLADRTATVLDIATVLDLPVSTVALHVETLEQAGLISTELEPASRGLQKTCRRLYDRVNVELPTFDPPQGQAIEVSMPIGAFIDCQAVPTCGLVNQTDIIGLLDNAASFYEPDRVTAQLIWFQHGYLEYRFPNRLPVGAEVETLRLSAEICSEAPHYNLDWPSDITLWVNKVEIGTWTSPGDFGGERGGLTPEWWPTRYTQYGLLKVWQVNEQETAIDGMRLSGITTRDLQLDQSSFISVRLGIKPDAVHKGGLNIFGSKFGNYPQDLLLHLSYRLNPTSSNNKQGKNP